MVYPHFLKYQIKIKNFEIVSKIFAENEKFIILRKFLLEIHR